jgi:type II secretory pathway pseudopilin PulG
MRKIKQPGFVFMTSIIALVVMLVIGVLFLGTSLQQFRDARRDFSALQALAAAEAGLNYMIRLQQGATSQDAIRSGDGINPYALKTSSGLAPDTQLNVGNSTESTSAVWILTVPGNTEVYQIIAKGYYRGYERTLRVMVRAPKIITPPPPPPPGTPNPLPAAFDYALFGGEQLNIKSNTTVRGGDVGSNGSIDLKAKADIGGKVFALEGNTVSINKNVAYDEVVMMDAPVALPPIDYAWYEAIARENGAYHTGDWQMTTDFTFPTGGVVFIEGDMHVTGHTLIHGVGTIVVTGNVMINGHTRTDSATNSYLLLMAGGNVKITAHTTIDAFVYSVGGVSGIDKTASHIVLNGGMVSGETCETTAWSEINYRKPHNDVPYPPPGGGGGDDDDDDDARAWSIASWQMLN